MPKVHSADVWLFALVGLLSTAMLGGFLLTVTGRARRIETAVRDRTAALQAEVRERRWPNRRCARASSASATS